MDPETGTEVTAPQTPAAEATAPAPAPTPREDPLDAQIRAQEEIVRKEEEEAKAAAGQPASAPAPATTNATPAPTPAPAAVTPAPAADPKDAAIAANRRRAQEAENARRALELENARLQGQLDALASTQVTASIAPGTKPPSAALTPQQQIERAQNEKYDLAAQYDAGKINSVTFEQQKDALERRVREIERAELKKEVAAANPSATARPTESLTLAERTAQIETRYPVLKGLSDARINLVVDLAYDKFGTAAFPDGEAGTLALREKCGELATALWGEGAPATTTTTPGTTPAVPALSRDAQGREAKLAMAATMPPDASTVGTAAQPSNGMLELEQRLASSRNETEQLKLMDANRALVEKELGVRLR